MPNISLPNTITNGTTADASEVQGNFNEIVTYINARDDGTTDWQFVSSGGLITAKALVRANDGLVTGPAYSFTSDVDSGAYLAAAGDYRIATAGADAFSFGTATNQSNHTVEVPVGLVGTPSLTFSTDTDTGLYRAAANEMRVTTNGADSFSFGTTTNQSNHPLEVQVGSAGAPGLTFAGDNDTGIYRNAANQFSITAGGTEVIRYTATTALAGSVQYQASAGNAAGPGVSFEIDTDLGIYRDAADVLGISAGGTKRAQFTANGMNIVDGAVGTPAYSFLNDSDSGLISADTNTAVGIVSSGAEVARFDDTATAGETRFLIYDVDNATLERVSVGAADSGGTNFKVLRIPN